VKGYILKTLLILCLTITLTSPVSADLNTPQKGDNDFLFGVRGRSFTVTFSLDEEKYTDVFTFGSDGSFTMDSFSEIENSSGFYRDLLGILFLANFSGSFPVNSFSFSFYGIYLSPNICGINIIHYGGSLYCGTFFGTEI